MMKSSTHALKLRCIKKCNDVQHSHSLLSTSHFISIKFTLKFKICRLDIYIVIIILGPKIKSQCIKLSQLTRELMA